MATTVGDRAMRISEVCLKVGMGKTWIESAVAAGHFPQPFKPGQRTRLWLQSEVDQWLAERAAARRPPDIRSA